MPVPKTDDLLNPTLKAMHALGGSASFQELNEEVINGLKLKAKDLEETMPSDGRTVISYRLAWARTLLRNYGLLENSSRGVWTLTSAGHRTKMVDPIVVKQALKPSKGAEGRKAQNPKRLQQENGGNPEDSENQDWKKRLLGILLQMEPSGFERLCQLLLRESGFLQVRVTGRTGDGGIDGVGLVQIGGLISFPVVFQCKRYKGVVSAGTVRNFRGAMAGRADRGLVITTGSFSQPAWQGATRAGVAPIDLIDGDKLVMKLKELQLGIDIRMIEEIGIKQDWFLNI
jgi:restriction system protein